VMLLLYMDVKSGFLLWHKNIISVQLDLEKMR
jgi:hypothetical protein